MVQAVRAWSRNPIVAKAEAARRITRTINTAGEWSSTFASFPAGTSGEPLREVSSEPGSLRVNIHEQFLREAVALAWQARREGNHPFGALLVLDGQVVLTARNSVATDQDPTAHAETNLVARAIRELSPDQLATAVLYTSCEPCAMCVGKMYWAGIRAVVYALPAEELALKAGPDFLVPCRELFFRATETVSVLGPILVEGARAVQEGFWDAPKA